MASDQQRIKAYLKNGHHVHGWLDRYSADFIAGLSRIQRDSGIAGAVGEIGVHMGRLFILLKLTAAQNEKCFALDVFGEQHLNIDQSGFGDRNMFLRNVNEWTGDADIAVLQSSSLDVRPADITDAVGRCRLLSIDGGHTEDIARHDLRLAEAVLTQDGVAILDDFFNQSWPGVAAGAAQYFFDPAGRLRPFAISPNKLYLAAPACHGFYRSTLMRTEEKHFDKTARMFGREVDVFGCQPMPMGQRIRNTLRRSRLGSGVRFAKRLLSLNGQRLAMLAMMAGAASLIAAMDPAGVFGGAASATSDEALDAKHLPAHIFAADSFWYRPIPKDVPLHPDSENFAREFVRQLKAYYGHVTVNVGRYSAPVYLAGPEVRATSVAAWDCQKRGRLDPRLEEQWRAVPIPENAQPSEDSDSEMTIYQSSSDTLWEFWKAQKVGGRWQACWGGRLQNASKSDGIWPRYYGAVATGLPLLGGMITVDELRRGRIDHVMGIALVQTEHWNVLSWPANRSDGSNPTKLPNRIPEGLRFRLDPSIDIDALKLNPIARTIAKAAQTYGFVVWDKAGAIALRAEDPKRFTTAGQPNPYPDLWKGTPSYAILTGFPWDRLQFLPMNYGKP
ncbi:MAG: class I SAM-dependent methyltransferase [Pseudolabrys sp.]